MRGSFHFMDSGVISWSLVEVAPVAGPYRLWGMLWWNGCRGQTVWRWRWTWSDDDAWSGTVTYICVKISQVPRNIMLVEYR